MRRTVFSAVIILCLLLCACGAGPTFNWWGNNSGGGPDCSKSGPVPVVKTDSVRGVTYRSARVTVTVSGANAEYSRGVCWVKLTGSTTPVPKLDNNLTMVLYDTQAGPGKFTLEVSGTSSAPFKAGETYAIRGFSGSQPCVMGYGEIITFTLAPASAPIVNTHAVTDLTSNSAMGHGEVLSDEGEQVLSRGICLNVSGTPTISDTIFPDSDSEVTKTAGLGNFNIAVTSLTSGTTYYVRAYATNTIGTSYGEEVTFTTP